MRTVLPKSKAAAAAVALAICCCLLLLLAVAATMDARTAEPTAQRLQRDLGLLARTVPEFARPMPVDAVSFDLPAMVHYYSSTTLRDYKLLAWFTGSTGMHTSLELARPSPYPACGQLRQVLHVLAHLPSAPRGRPTRILEVGFGKGANAIFLAQLLPDARVEGVDVVPEHLDFATGAATRSGLTNTRFRLADATQPGALRSGPDAAPLDLIYGIEALCHIDTDARLAAFLAQAAAALAPGGRIVVVDGFRADDFAALPEPVQQAMNLAERAWRIRRMTSCGVWKRLAAQAGFELVAEQDLTSEALPFWLRWWRVIQAALWLRPLLHCFFATGGWRAETGCNFAACLMFAYALALGSAKYGVLVFAKPGTAT